jgi:short-subunit dehydrogenase
MTKLQDRRGQWALVTGASSGIGQAMAEYLAGQGMCCVLLSENPFGLKAEQEKITERYGVKTRICCVDLSAPSDFYLAKVRETVKDIEISILVNNASFGITGEFWNNTLENYEELLNVNVRAYLSLTREFLPEMIARNDGSLIFVSSLNALFGIGGCAVYTASKAFEYSFAQSLWYELKRTKINVQIILPGPTKTNFQARAGTKVSAMAWAPEKLVRLATASLGRKLVYIPGWKFRLLVFLSPLLPLKLRINVVSNGYQQALHDHPERKMHAIVRNLFRRRGKSEVIRH